MALTAVEMANIVRSLGLDRYPRSYRNFFAACCSDLEHISPMVRKGLMTLSHYNAGLTFFYVTDKGIKEAGLDDRVRDEDRRE